MKKAENQSLTTWSGLDVSKDTFDAGICLLSPNNSEPLELDQIPVSSFPRTEKGVKLFHHWSFIQRDKAGLEGGNMRIVMESTGRYSLELTRWLNKELPFTKPAIEDPKVISDFIKSLKVRNKTDKIDAAAISRYGAERKPKAFIERPVSYQYLRELTRQRTALSSQLVAARLRLKEMKHFKELINIQQGVVDSLKLAMDKLKIELKRHINENKELRESIEFATSVPGIGELTAATILAECGPLRFFSSRQIGAYSGLAPAIRQSGTSLNCSRINKRGPSELRRILYMASVVGVEYNPKMKAFYSRLISKGKKPIQARCAVMHKLLILARTVVVNKTKYDKNYGLTS